MQKALLIRHSHYRNSRNNKLTFYRTSILQYTQKPFDLATASVPFLIFYLLWIEVDFYMVNLKCTHMQQSIKHLILTDQFDVLICKYIKTYFVFSFDIQCISYLYFNY